MGTWSSFIIVNKLLSFMGLMTKSFKSEAGKTVSPWSASDRYFPLLTCSAIFIHSRFNKNIKMNKKEKKKTLVSSTTTWQALCHLEDTRDEWVIKWTWDSTGMKPVLDGTMGSFLLLLITVVESTFVQLGPSVAIICLQD